MQVVAVIPARFGSTRFPGKPLLRQTGKYLIQHVYERVLQARRIDLCLIATDDERIMDAAASFGGRAVITRADHPSGTDRIAEAVSSLETRFDLVLNVQGDEPEIEPGYLDQLVSRMAEDESVAAGTLACPFAADADPRDPNCVKVVRNREGKALYFSRALIPYPRDGAASTDPGTYLLHLGVYAYRRDFLLKFASLPPSRLEQIEKLEQLRVLECGYGMAVEVVERASPGVDTPTDYDRFVARWQRDKANAD